MTVAAASTVTTERPLAAGDGWRVIDHVCRSGPGDPAFEERHEPTSVAIVLDGSFAYRSGGGRALMSPGSLLLGNRHACFTCAHDHGRGDRCAAASGISRHHFLRVFRAVAGVTPYRYILTRRLTAAAEALSSGDGTVLEIAMAAGFSDLSEFTRRFRRRFGMPPAAYRRRRRG